MSTLNSAFERLQDDELVENALRKAAALAMLRHKNAGVPAAVWRDGQVVWIAPQDIEIDEELLRWDPSRGP